MLPDASPTVLITGATAGLGRYLAHLLDASGWTVLVHGRDPARIRDLLGSLSGRAEGYLADLASLVEVRDLALRLRATVTGLDVLVNNAGVGFGPPGQERQISRDGHELRFAVNYLAPVLLARELAPLLTASVPSRIINVGSIGQVPFDPEDASFERGYDGVQAYRRAKLALAAFTIDLADELHGAGVTVNCVHPAGFMNTAMVLESGVTPLSTVEQGGEAVLRLVTDAAMDGVTGHFFDGPTVARARPEVYDASFRCHLRKVTDRLLGDARPPARIDSAGAEDGSDTVERTSSH